MAAGTSRAVTVLPNGNLAVAFHGADGVLWTWAGAAGNVGTASSWAGFVMAAGTSPAITTLSNGQPAMAYQASNGDLSAEVFAFGNGTVAVGHFVDTGLAMASGTNPSITPLAGSAPVGTAFQASNGQLSTWDGTLELATLASSSTGLPWPAAPAPPSPASPTTGPQ